MIITRRGTLPIMSDKEDTIFGKIIDGEIPCHRIYEDDHVLAFLDVGPLGPGHALVIPKERTARLEDLSDDSAAAIGRVLPRLCRAVMKAAGADAYNVLCNTGPLAGQVVMHVHFHIIPKFRDSGLDKAWDAGSLETEDAERLLAGMRETLRIEG